MMETADFRQRYDLAHGGRLDGAGFRRVLPQGQVRSRTVIVGDHNEDAIGGRAGNALRVGEAYTRESGMRTNYLFCLCLIMDSIACGRAELESPNLTGGAIASVLRARTFQTSAYATAARRESRWNVRSWG